jgi:chemotaxis protein MotB
MATFSDLLTLMLTFFVLLLSMSSMDDKALSDAFGFFKDKMGLLKQSASVKTTNPSAIPVSAFLTRQVLTGLDGEDLRDAEQAARLVMKIEKMIDENKLEHLLEVRQVLDGISITIAAQVWFGDGDDLQSSSFPILDALADLLTSNPSLHLQASGVQGSITPGRDPWVQATARGLSVLAYLLSLSMVEARQLSVAGYGPGWKFGGLSRSPDKLELTLTVANQALRT